MKTSFSALTALLLAGAMHIPPAHADRQTQPAPEFSVWMSLGLRNRRSRNGSKKGYERGFTARAPKSGAKKKCARRAERATTAIG